MALSIAAGTEVSWQSLNFKIELITVFFNAWIN